MKNYRLDPKNPPQLTPEEARRAEQEKERAAEEAWIDSVLRDRPRALPKEQLTAAHIENVKPGRREPEALTAKCTWIGCAATTERPALDGWTYFTDCGPGIKDDGIYYCPPHAAALEAILREGELDEP